MQILLAEMCAISKHLPECWNQAERVRVCITHFHNIIVQFTDPIEEHLNLFLYHSLRRMKLYLHIRSDMFDNTKI